VGLKKVFPRGVQAKFLLGVLAQLMKTLFPFFLILITSMAAALRTVGKLTPKSSILMLCDIQDRFRPLIHEGESIVSQANFLCRIGSELDVPVVCTEQYVKVSIQQIVRDLALGLIKVARPLNILTPCS
jgi:hypothetical protein